VDDFAQRLSILANDDVNLRDALDAVKNGQMEPLTDLGMPASAWNEVSFILSKLIKSGFIGNA